MTAPGTESTGRRSWVIAAAMILGEIVAVLVVVRVHHIYEEGGELRLTPSAAPPLIHQWGRDYRRSDGAAATLPRQTHPVGQTPGGGTIYEGEARRAHVPQRDAKAYADAVPTVLWVEDGDTVVVYELAGGP